MVNKYISDVVELRHPAILQTKPTAYRGVQFIMGTNGGLIFLYITNNVFHMDVEETNTVCIIISSQEVLTNES
jgi:hypothetical protein